MSDLSSIMEADIQSKAASPLGQDEKGTLGGIAKLAENIAQKEADVAALEEKLKDAKKALLRLTDEELPLLMTEMGVSSFKLSDGSQVEIKKIYGASIPVASREEAFKWLRANGHGDMVKNVVSVGFGMGEDSMAAEFSEMALSKGLHPDQKESVHPSRLRSWVKEQVEEGAEFPMELFGAFIGQRAIIKGAK